MEMHVAQRPEMAVLPAMLQSLEVLQLAAPDLEAWLAEQAASNELLELLPPAAPGAGQGGAVDLDGFPAPPKVDLMAFLRRQLAWLDSPPELSAKVLAVAELLDARGLLAPADAGLAAEVAGADLPQVLEVLRRLEPRGIGAGSSVDAMLAQLDEDDPDRPILARLLHGHLDDLARHRLARVARAMDLPVDELSRLLARAGTLNPRPVADLDSAAATAVVPDLEAVLEGDEVRVRLCDDRLPELRIDPCYRDLGAGGPLEVRRYLRPKLSAARRLVRALADRRRTLLAVAGAVMHRQRPFLADGTGSIRALRMDDVAAELGVHGSTVSRAVAHKTVGTSHGYFPLRVFFAGGRTDGDGVVLSNAAIRERIRRLIADEDPKRPLADARVADLLAAAGIVVARRTVAKYREQMGIRAASARRRRP